MGTRPNVHFIAFGTEPLFSPKDQIKPLSLLAQPAVVSKSIDAVARLKRRRAASPDAQRPVATAPQSQTATSTTSASANATAHATDATSGAVSTSACASASAERSARRWMCVAEILGALGFQRPFCDAAGRALRPGLLSKRFHTAYSDMTSTSGGRSELLLAATCQRCSARNAPRRYGVSLRGAAQNMQSTCSGRASSS